jgi:hypothetical protein
MNGEWVQGFGPGINPNPLLGWETGITMNVGVDFELWKRLRGSFDFFDRRSKNLLYTAEVPQPPLVHPTMIANIGTTINRGIELSLEGDIFKGRKLDWTSSILYSYGTTRMQSISNDVYNVEFFDLYQKPGMGVSEHFFRLYDGQRIGEFLGYKHAGVDDEGYLTFYGADGEVKRKGTEDPLTDKRFIGNGSPGSFLSWSNTLRYGQWDLNIFMRGAFGFDIFNFRRYEMGTMSVVNTNNVLREAYTKNRNITHDAQFLSSFYLENGSYFKIDNITLGYNFKFRESGVINNLRVFLSAKNVHTFTGYTGNDPSTVQANGLTPGVDTGSAYPQALQISAGVTIRFN